MFSFFHRSSVIDVDCFTANNDAYKYTPIVKSSKARPTWYDHVLTPQQSNTKWPQYKVDEKGNIDFNWHISLRTIKACPGFHDLYGKGFMLENWCDSVFNINDDNISFHYSNGDSPLLHTNDQTKPGFTNHYIIKMKSPWVIQCNQDVQFMLVGAEWSHEDYDFHVLPGIVNFYYQTSSNVFMTIRKNIKQQFHIPMGMPLAQFVPLTDKKIRIHNHIVTEDELRTKTYTVTGTSFGWRRTKSLIKRNDNRKSKCPFGFGE